MKDLILKARPNPDQSNSWINAFLNKDRDVLSQLQAYTLKKIELIAREFDWFDQLHIFRQDSLYCDYQDYMKNPAQISADNYYETVARLEKVRTVALGLIETLNSKDGLYVNHYDSMKRMFIEKQFYQHIEAALNRLKGTRDTPFQALKKYFKS
jgi:hypothetical protein